MSIARLTTTFAFSLLAAQLASGVAAAACPNPGKTTELEFKVKPDGCVEKVKKKDGTDGETIKVCETDKVQWKVGGKDKKIVFDGKSPFEWTDSGFKDNKIEGTVKAGTARLEPYKYSVSVMVNNKECVLDPKIIVEP
jgi:hypothetical protein